VIGHQVGSGRGNTLATAGGASPARRSAPMSDRDRSDGYAQRRRRCENVVAAARPTTGMSPTDYRGVEHRMQTTYRPGPTVTVNANGEPRS
jgi:uncharacterized protein YcfJ